MSRRRRLVAFVLTTPLLLAACGEDDANRDSLVSSLIETAELSEEDANCVADAVFSDSYVTGLEQGDINDAANDPASDPEFQAVIDTALASCLGL